MKIHQIQVNNLQNRKIKKIKINRLKILIFLEIRKTISNDMKAVNLNVNINDINNTQNWYLYSLYLRKQNTVAGKITTT